MNKSKMVGIIILSLGLAGVLLTMQIPVPAIHTQDPGPRMFPYFGSTILIICGIGILFEKSDKSKVQKPFLTKEGWKRASFILGLIIIYGIALKVIGFLIATPIMLYVFLQVLSADKKISLIKGIMFSVIVTSLVYVVFEYMLSVILPPGSIF